MYQPDLNWTEGSHEEPHEEPSIETRGLQADDEPTVVPWVTYLHAPSSAQANGHVVQEFLRHGKCP